MPSKRAGGNAEKGSMLLFIFFGIPAIATFAACLVVMVIGSYFFGGLTLLLCKWVLGVKPKSKDMITRHGKKKRRVLLVTDTSQQQICGVLRKFNELQHHLRELGHDVEVLHTDMFINFSLPRFEEVKIAVPTPMMIYTSTRLFCEFDPDIVNLLTEGNCGLVVRCLCLMTGTPFTTMWCTRYDLYMGDLLGERVAGLGRAFLKWFHGPAEKVITPSPSMGKALIEMGLVSVAKCRPIMNGCDTTAFSPDGPLLEDMKDMPRPIWLYVGRVSHEKNIKSLLDLHDRLKGSIAIVGKGPYFDEAVETFSGKKVKFLGWRQGEELTAAYRTADVFVFTSKTDTFGQVNIEAMASGLPVAAFPVTGPIDLVVDGVGAVDEDLHAACTKAYSTKDSKTCIKHAKSFSWAEMTKKFLEVHQDI